MDEQSEGKTIMKKFKKHKFIPVEKLASSFLDSKDINFDYKNDLVDFTQIVKTGFAQYAITEVESKEIIIKCQSKDNRFSRHDFGIRFNELYTVKGFEYLKGYSKVKPIYTIRNRQGERMNINDNFPSGKFLVELIGLLVK